MTHPVTEEQPKPTVKKRTLSDNLRAIKYTLTSIWANLRFMFRTIIRELKYFLPLQDLVLLFFWLGILIVLLLVFLIYGIPGTLRIIPTDPFRWRALQVSIYGAIFNETTIRYGAGIIGIGTVLVRLMLKSPLSKYKDKVNARNDVTYIFGSTKPAEQFLTEMIFQYGYEERVSLISDADLIWVQKLGSQIDIYKVPDLREFEKPNLYDLIGFKNARRVMILTDSIELNQNILTNIRRVRPDVDIILLSQFTPAWAFSEIVQDPHLIILDDLEVTIEAMVTSLSLDFTYPPTTEINVPRTYIGWCGNDMTTDIPKFTVLLIRRGDELFSPYETLQKGDRVVIYFENNYQMMLANRVATELPLRSKKSKKKKKKKKGKKEIADPTPNAESNVLLPLQKEKSSQSIEDKS